MTKHSNTITDQEILDAIKRSGYLLESRIVKMLDEAGYWVQPNYVMKDPVTGKGREIDIIVEPSPWQYTNGGVTVKTTFIIELVNYNSPLVFFTAKTDSDMSDMFDGIKFATTGETNIFENEILERYKGQKNRGSVFMQYCAFEKKSNNNNWMAYHPDDLYSSFQKFFYYITEVLERWERQPRPASLDKDNRIFFWQPIICTSGGIRIVDHEGNMREASQIKYEYQYAEGDAHGSNSMQITVVTTGELLNFMDNVIEQDSAIVKEFDQKTKTGVSAGTAKRSIS